MKRRRDAQRIRATGSTLQNQRFNDLEQATIAAKYIGCAG
jgi:hypothetical protein